MALEIRRKREVMGGTAKERPGTADRFRRYLLPAHSASQPNPTAQRRELSACIPKRPARDRLFEPASRRRPISPPVRRSASTPVVNPGMKWFQPEAVSTTKAIVCHPTPAEVVRRSSAPAESCEVHA
jgi:hypothetical protein